MSRPQTDYGSVPNPDHSQLTRGYGTAPSTGVADFAQGNAAVSSPLSQSAAQQGGAGAFHEDFDASQRGSSIIGDDGAAGVNRSASSASTAVHPSTPARSNTLKKKASVRRTGSLKRSSSKRSLAAGSIKGYGGEVSEQDFNSAFYTPIPTQGTPTEILANRFQAWRQLLKSLITYFREIQNSYETRAKALTKVESTISNITHPSIFVSEHGLADATRILDAYHKRSIAEAQKSRDIENDVIGALTGLRSDLGQKIKEIKSLGGDFKNSVEKEKEGTRREVDKLQEALQHADHEDGAATGKNDPFVVKLGVDRMIERQIDEENYLHRAYLNLESSGRELESIVVGEIQKAYNALAGILKREGDDAYHTVESLRTGPISMPKDSEWTNFVEHDPHFVDPSIPLRRIEDIGYPGKNHPAAAEVRAGMLERKSKYLKSYTPGWYVLSPTHLHEFKSADKIYSQPPVMSLYLLDQKVGSKSEAGSSSYKFMLKGKQSGGVHKGHNWVFRAETHDTMLAWYEDIHALTESTGEQRNAYVRKHARSVSGTSDRGTVSSDGMEEDEADEVPYSADATSLAEQHPPQERAQRPQPGGRFPSDLMVPRSAPLSPSDGSSEPDGDAIAAAALLPGSAQQAYQRRDEDPYRLDGVPSGTRTTSGYSQVPLDGHNDQTYEPRQQPQTHVPTRPKDDYAAPIQTQYAQSSQQTQAEAFPSYQEQPVQSAKAPTQAYGLLAQPSPYAPQGQQQNDAPTNQARNVTTDPVQTQMYSLPTQQPQPVNQQQVPVNQPSNPASAVPQQQPQQQSFLGGEPAEPVSPLARRSAEAYGDWFAPTAAGVAGAGAGVLGAEAYHKHQQRETPVSKLQPGTSLPEQVAAPAAGQPYKGSESTLIVPRESESREAKVAQGDDDVTVLPTDGIMACRSSIGDASSAAQPTHDAAALPAYNEPRSEPVKNDSTYAPVLPAAASGSGGEEPLGGLESKGAHETGRIFPIVRHDTEMSISALHVPGEFPKRQI